jgi:hydrogenase nickel incorporation protein HypB
MRRVSLGRSALAGNDAVAARNRALFESSGVCVMNLIGSPGSGKTSILQYTARHFPGRMAAIIGDVKTALDAKRLQQCGIQAHAIETGGGCHLDAAQVASVVKKMDLAGLDLLFIENVGNLVCPSTFDLGERMKVAVLSVPEGDEKVRKYPALFLRADVLFINKTDLLPHCPFDVERVKEDARKVRPGVTIFETSAARGAGFEPWFDFLRQARRGAAATDATPPPS